MKRIWMSWRSHNRALLARQVRSSTGYTEGQATPDGARLLTVRAVERKRMTQALLRELERTRA
jgi:hypothetical protein